MAAAYDTYDYPSYWEKRAYEHESENIAIGQLLKKVKNANRILEIGGGFGRLTPSYSFRAKKVILTDPSARLLKIARETLVDNKIDFIQAKLLSLHKKIKPGSVDLAIMVRVIHHIDDTNAAFFQIHKLLKKRGYLILEFANKLHFKSKLIQVLKGNFTFPLEIFPEDIRSKKNKKKRTLPFKNYHPDDVTKKLEDRGFEIVEKLSVSNIRSDALKRLLPLDTLIFLEKGLQKPLSYFSFGPSMFILAKKKVI